MGINQHSRMCHGCHTVRFGPGCATCAARARAKLHARGVCHIEPTHVSGRADGQHVYPREVAWEWPVAAFLRFLTSFAPHQRERRRREEREGWHGDAARLRVLVDAAGLTRGQTFVHARACWTNERVRLLEAAVLSYGWCRNGRLQWITPHGVRVISASSASDIKGHAIDRAVVDEGACPYLEEVVRAAMLGRAAPTRPPHYVFCIPGDVESGTYTFAVEFTYEGASREQFSAVSAIAFHHTQGRKTTRHFDEGVRLIPHGAVPSRYYESFNGGPWLRRDAERYVRTEDGGLRVERDGPCKADWDEAFAAEIVGDVARRRALREKLCAR